jgi:putative phosphoribosyl transferase
MIEPPAKLFRCRIDAGRVLSEKLGSYADRSDVAVLALPRGGVPVAFEVAKALRVPLDLFLVRKLGVPGHEELAMGAIASGGVRVLNQDVIRTLEIPGEKIEAVTRREEQELARREQAYRGNRSLLSIRGRTIILIDDGLATGSTMRAAVAAVRQQGPARIIVAVPIAAPDTCEAMRVEVDEMVCVVTPEPFYGVGMWYEDFSQTTDQEVRDLLVQAAYRIDNPGAPHEGCRDQRIG